MVVELVNEDFRKGHLREQQPGIQREIFHNASAIESGRADIDDSISNRAKGVSLIIPAYNEADRISKALDAYIPVLDSMNLQYEIIVIIDGKDETHKIVNGYNHEKIKCYHFNSKLGRGGAILKGFEVSAYSIIGYTDADGSLSPHDLPTLIGYCGKFDCVVGSRWIEGSKWINKEPMFNSIAGRVYNLLIRGILGVPISDTEGGGKFFRARVIDSTLPKIRVTNRAFTASLFYHIRRKSFTIAEVPITWDHDGNTRMPVMKAIPVMFITLVGVRLMNLPVRRLAPRFLLDFFIRKFSTT